ncbi:MAG: hypothetical protein K2J28_08155, partial [Duncaniella sp.]|nr:hypothetical protein [Duncaniella sp.]
DSPQRFFGTNIESLDGDGEGWVVAYTNIPLSWPGGSFIPDAPGIYRFTHDGRKWNIDNYTKFRI